MVKITVSGIGDGVPQAQAAIRELTDNILEVEVPGVFVTAIAICLLSSGYSSLFTLHFSSISFSREEYKLQHYSDPCSCVHFPLEPCYT